MGTGGTDGARAVPALSAEELGFVTEPPRALARIATVDANGLPHVVPGQWAWDPEDEVFVLGGRDVLRTARARNVAASGTAAFVVDGVTTTDGWAPWALVVRGRAHLDAARDAIVVHPDRVTSWGLASAS